MRTDRRTRFSLSATALLFLAACNSPTGPASITSVSPATALLGEETTIVIQGHNLIAQLNHRTPQVEVCGVALGQVEVNETRRLVVPLGPGGSRTVQLGDELRAVLGAGARAGVSDVTVSLPGGKTLVLEDAFECLPARPTAPTEPGISIVPLTGTMATGESRQFTATVVGLTDDSVSWSVTGSGSIDDPAANPVTFTAPAEPGTASLTVSSVADPSLTATVELTFEHPELTVSITPDIEFVYPLEEKVFTATVDGWPDGRVTWDYLEEPTTDVVVDGNQLTFRVAPDNAGNAYSFRATSVANPERHASVNVTVVPTPIELSPQNVTLRPGETVTFSLLVEGEADPGTTWSSTGGTFSSTLGASVQYTAPFGPAGTTEFKVTALSSRYPEGASATVELLTQLAGAERTPFGMCPSELATDHANRQCMLTGQKDNCYSDSGLIAWRQDSGISEVQGPDYGTVNNAVLLRSGTMMAALSVLPDACLGAGLVLYLASAPEAAPPCTAVAGEGRAVDLVSLYDSTATVLLDADVPGRDFAGLLSFAVMPDRTAILTSRIPTVGTVHPERLLLNDSWALVAGTDAVTSAPDLHAYVVGGFAEAPKSIPLAVGGYAVDRVTAMTWGDGQDELLLALLAREQDNLSGPNRIVLQSLNWVTGEELWHSDLGLSGNLGARGLMTADGNIFIAGQARQESGLSEAFLAKLSGEGEPLWREHIASSAADIAFSTRLRPWTPGHLMVGGYRSPLSAPDDVSAGVWIFAMD